MSAYVIIDIEVIDQKLYAQYVKKVPVTVEQYGGRYLARGGKIEVLSGDWRPQRLILIEFPSREHLYRWLGSPEYSAIAELRIRSTKGKAIVVEGIA